MLSIELIVRSDEAKTRNISSSLFFHLFAYLLSPMVLIFDFWRHKYFVLLCQIAMAFFGATRQVAKTLAAIFFSLVHCTFYYLSSGLVGVKYKFVIICQICALHETQKFVVFLAITCQVMLKLFIYEIIFLQGIMGQS